MENNYQESALALAATTASGISFPPPSPPMKPSPTKSLTTSGKKSKGTGNGKRRQSLSKAEVHAIFYCILNNKDELPEGLNIKIIVVPKIGGNNGLKLSPPPYEYEDGVYVLLRLNVAVPSNLSDLALNHQDLAQISDRSWSLSGPQYSGNNVVIQQRYCTPRWNLEESDQYCKSTKGSIWTMIGANGEEKYDCRVFHVYHSAKRAANMNDAAAKQADTATSSPLSNSPKVKRSRKSSSTKNQTSPKKSPIPEAHVSLSDVVGLLAPLTAELPECDIKDKDDTSDRTNSDNVIVEQPKKQRKKRQSPKASKKPDTPTSNAEGKARQTTRSWTKDEDAKLAHLVSIAGPDVTRIAWNELAFQMENRSGKQCRERYINHLKPDRKKGQWTDEEDDHILTLQASLGNQWSKIAAGLIGRSDNDVKNRWHSRMRTQRRRGKPSTSDEEKPRVRKRRSKASTNETREETGDGLSAPQPASSPNAMKDESIKKNRKGPPKVGMRVLVRFDGGKMYGGIITKVTKQEEERYSVMIHYDDGASEETAFPDQDISLLPMENELTDNEVHLCHELLNLHSALKKPKDEEVVDSGGGGILPKNQVSEEESHDEHNNNAKKISSSAEGCSKSVERTNVQGEELAKDSHSDMKPSTAKGPDDKESMRSTLQALSNADNLLRPIAAPTMVASPRSIIGAAQGMDTSSLLSHGSRHPPSGLNFQITPAFQHTQAPFFALPSQQQQQLLMAARLLSSVNPGLAVAAIASARHLHNITGVVQQNHHVQNPGGLLLTRLQQQLTNNMFPAARQFNYPPPNGEPIAVAAATRQFNYPPPPISNLSAQGRVERNNAQSNEAMAAVMLAALPPSPSPNAGLHKGS